MPPSKTRFITACQQILALGVVLAALTPAASVVSLDVVRERALRRPPAPPAPPRDRRVRGVHAGLGPPVRRADPDGRPQGHASTP